VVEKQKRSDPFLKPLPVPVLSGLTQGDPMSEEEELMIPLFLLGLESSGPNSSEYSHARAFFLNTQEEAPSNPPN
jgi:hypothetical protein